MKKICFFLPFLLLSPINLIARQTASQASFVLNYTGFSPSAQAVFVEAANIWSAKLYSDVPIKINAIWTTLPVNMYGITFPNGVKNFTGAPYTDVWYPASLADAISGVDQNPGEYDMDIYLNNSVNWYYGIDGNTPSNKVDLLSLILHEMCHGLGLVGTGKVDGSGKGSFGEVTQADYAPLTTSFTFPNMGGLPSIFDYLLINGSAQVISDTNIFPNQSISLASEFTSDAVFFSALSTDMVTAGGAKIEASTPFYLGSSMTHLDENTYPSGDVNALMTPYSDPGEHIHDAGPIVYAMLQDMGWQLNLTSTVKSNNNALAFLKCWPNPSGSIINLDYKILNEEVITAKVYNAQGKQIMTLLEEELHPPGEYSIVWDGIDYSGARAVSSIYTIVVASNQSSFSSKIILMDK